VHFLNTPTMLNVTFMEYPSSDPNDVPAQSDSVFVAGLPLDKDQSALVEGFSQFKAIKSLQMVPGQANNSALIEFYARDDAKFFVDNLNGRIPHFLTEQVQVLYATNPNSRANGAGDQQADGSTTSRFSFESPTKTGSRPNLSIASSIPTPCRRGAGPRTAANGSASSPALCVGSAYEAPRAWKRVESQRNPSLFFYYQGAELPDTFEMDKHLAEMPQPLRAQELRGLGLHEYPQARRCLDEVPVR